MAVGAHMCDSRLTAHGPQPTAHGPTRTTDPHGPSELTARGSWLVRNLDELAHEAQRALLVAATKDVEVVEVVV